MEERKIGNMIPAKKTREKQEYFEFNETSFFLNVGKTYCVE